MRSGQHPDLGSEARGGDDDQVIDGDTVVADCLRQQREVIRDTRGARPTRAWDRGYAVKKSWGAMAVAAFAENKAASIACAALMASAWPMTLVAVSA
jgi:hypothetical protein